MEGFYCCDGEPNWGHGMVSPGVCKIEHWDEGTLEDGTSCTLYKNECACPPTHAWDWDTDLCLPKDYCAQKYQKCGYGEVFFEGCAPDDIWDGCCSTEFYDYVAGFDQYYEDYCQVMFWDKSFYNRIRLEFPEMAYVQLENVIGKIVQLERFELVSIPWLGYTNS